MRREFFIKRVAYRADGTFGVLMDGNTPFALTLERPWRSNQPQVSCIPEGRYIARRVQSPKFGNTFEITGVPGRSLILFHQGNIEDDSRGCVLVGEKFSIWSDGRVSVAASAEGFQEFRVRTADVDELDVIVEGNLSNMAGGLL